MGFNHDTGNTEYAPAVEPDTILSELLKMASMIPFGLLIYLAMPTHYAIFCPQWTASSVSDRLFYHPSAPEK